MNGGHGMALVWAWAWPRHRYLYVSSRGGQGLQLEMLGCCGMAWHGIPYLPRARHTVRVLCVCDDDDDDDDDDACSGPVSDER